MYEPMRQRRKDNSFRGNGNVGALVVKDLLERAGYRVGSCVAQTAAEFDVVLVSLTSTHDIFALYRAVALLPSWQRGARKFKVLAGGFGMQNPTAIRDYIDYAFFGRVDDFLVEAFACIVSGQSYVHQSVMIMADWPSPVTIAQASKLYPHRVGDWQESFTGCPLKCKFCHYTFARRHQGSDEAYGYVQTQLSDGTPELTWDQLITWGKKLGRVRVAIDGMSERIRYVYGKRISNDDIVAGIEAVGRFPGTTTILAYNIVSFPGETADDEAELYAAIKRAQPRYRVILVLHSTPFRPSIATPMQWEPASIDVDWSRRRADVIESRSNLHAVHSFTLETPFSHACSVIAERATNHSDDLIHAIAFSPGLRKGTHAQCLETMRSHWDLAPYLREYDLNEELPAWFVSGYLTDDVLRGIARKMREQAGRASAEPGWVPAKGRGTLVDARVRRDAGKRAPEQQARLFDPGLRR